MTPMFRTLFIFFIFIFHQVNGQDSVTVTLKGKVTDDTLHKPVSYPSFELYTSRGESFSFQGDSLGNYQYKMKVPTGKLRMDMEVLSENYFTERIPIDTTINNEVTFKKDISMEPSSIICWDTFMPDEYFFKKDSFQLNSHQEEDLNQWIQANLSLTEDSIEFFVPPELYNAIKITAYSAYDEPVQIAKKRGEYIYNILMKNGFQKNQVLLEVKGHEDFFYCYYCTGCHYYFLKGKGVELTKNLMKNTENPDQIEEYQNLRRIVQLGWINN